MFGGFVTGWLDRGRFYRDDVGIKSDECWYGGYRNLDRSVGKVEVRGYRGRISS